jgi:cobalt-zinc-cadmium resistance protein CzcA
MPVLGFLILRGADISHKEPLFLRLIQAIYHPLLSFSLRFKFVFPMIVIPVFFYSLWIFSRIGSDFMPALNEGDMTIQFVHDSKISLTESIRRQRKIEKMILKYPQVNTVFARTGTSEAATDPMGVNLVDTFIILEKGPSENNRKDIQTESKQELFEKIRGEIEVEFKDVEVMQGQPIEMRFNEILEGSRADVSLRIYGKDLDALTDLQNKAKEILEGIPGVSEVELDALTALRKSPVLDVKLDFEKIALMKSLKRQWLEKKSGVSTNMTGDFPSSFASWKPIEIIFRKFQTFP